MANPEYSEIGYDAAPEAAAVSATMGWIGAACSLALVMGLGWWGWDLATRDTRGVPVIAALEGPSRVAPEEPGGFEAAHKGLSVTAVSSRSEPGGTEEVRLAPAPTGLSAEDQPIPAMRPKVREDALRDAVSSALQDAGAAPLEPEARPASATRAAPAGTVPRPRPRPRPDQGVVSRNMSAAAPLAPQSLDVDPGSIPAGTRLVQLGAYDSEETARSEWARAESRFGPYLADKQRVIEPTQVTGQTLYRLRVHGFDDLPEARRFCAALTAEKADCIPVLVR